jgi:N-acetylglucosaminyldiphosphoundecaprenol N-acetyl-beta-D-mannosaminyltransferase
MYEMRSRVSVLGVAFDDLTPDGAAAAAMELIAAVGEETPYIVTPNPEVVWSARTSPALREAIGAASLVLPDGVGITLGAWLLGTPLKGRAPGIDVAEKVIARLAESGGSVYLLGAKPGVAEKAGEKLAEKYPGLVIAGARDGYFIEDDIDNTGLQPGRATRDSILDDISARSPDFLLICLGFPRQEIWAYNNRKRLGARLAACLGGTLDVFAGNVRRAPLVFRKLGLEWLYRLIREPWRARRMTALPKFMLAALRARVTQRRSAPE